VRAACGKGLPLGEQGFFDPSPQRPRRTSEVTTLRLVPCEARGAGPGKGDGRLLVSVQDSLNAMPDS
jgi:hypothetical protein